MPLFFSIPSLQMHLDTDGLGVVVQLWKVSHDSLQLQELHHATSGATINLHDSFFGGESS